MHKKLVERLTKEFGNPATTLRWSIAPIQSGRASITIQVDGDSEGCKSIKVWIFNPAKGSLDTLYQEVSCDEDIESLIARVKADLQAQAGH